MRWAGSHPLRSFETDLSKQQPHPSSQSLLQLQHTLLQVLVQLCSTVSTLHPE